MARTLASHRSPRTRTYHRGALPRPLSPPVRVVANKSLDRRGHVSRPSRQPKHQQPRVTVTHCDRLEARPDGSELRGFSSTSFNIKHCLPTPPTSPLPTYTTLGIIVPFSSSLSVRGLYMLYRCKQHDVRFRVVVVVVVPAWGKVTMAVMAVLGRVVCAGYTGSLVHWVRASRADCVSFKIEIRRSIGRQSG